MFHRPLFAILVTSLALLGGTARCGKSHAAAEGMPETREKKGRTVTFDPKALERLGVVVGAVGGPQNQGFTVPGTLEFDPERYAEVGTLADGRVTSLDVHVGERVKKGQLLARIMVPSVATAQAELVAAAAASKIAATNEAREKNLLDRELTTAREAELARGDAVRTQAELSAAQARLAALGIGATGAKGGTGAIALSAPIEGVVVRRDAVLGRFLQAKETAFVVADPSVLQAEINVYESDIPYLKVGDDVALTIDTREITIAGKVTYIEPRIGRSSRALRAHLLVPNEDGSLRAGTFVRTQIKLPTSSADGSGRMFVPAEAVQPLGEEDVVFVERSTGLFEVRPVTVRRRTPQVVELGSELNAGERIALKGSFLLRGEVSKQ
jgi:cobalt-zinc-cadmium efflux system membrane fusion protein